MDLGVSERLFVVAADFGLEGDACKRILEAEGAAVRLASSLATAATVVEEAIEAEGRVDGVVMCYPKHSSRPIRDADLADLYQSWEAVENTAAAFSAAVPGMTENGWGRLVSVTTSAAKTVTDEIDEQGALAGLGMLGMHKAAVADIARFGISTNAVLRNSDSTPDEVANTVAFLMSERAGYLQGVTLSMDGATSPTMF